jgi:GT2 family glycosyltransferase
VLIDTIRHLDLQTRRADGVTVVAVTAADVRLLETLDNPPRILFAQKGLCAQRNHGLATVAEHADLIIFFDDDFVPAANYLEQAELEFTQDPSLVGATGQVIADGARNAGISFDDAVRTLAAGVEIELGERPVHSLYGCNMVMRASALAGLRFDEALPLYGWQEDIDFTFRLGQRGRLMNTSRLQGVHMGAKSGRASGIRLGYSQVANPIYIHRRGNMPGRFAYYLIFRNMIANLLKSAWPEPYIDRRGRLRGNVIAATDLFLGKLDPRRILELQ